MTDFLIGDIGGTNARLALANSSNLAIRNLKTFSPNDFATFRQVVERYLAELPAHEAMPTKACFAVASPIMGDQVVFTNNPWSFSISELSQNLPFQKLRIINDFFAIAMSLPHLKPQWLKIVGPQLSLDDKQVLGVIGPGTGLGMAMLINIDGRRVALPTEGGHAGWCPTDDFEAEVWKVLAKKLDFVSREELLSGQGLVNLSQAIATVDGLTDFETLQPEDITSRALTNEDSWCRKTLDYFCAILGATAGDFALQTGARGGVFIAGGIIPRIEEFFLQSRFREKFDSKGRFHHYVKDIPTFLISAGQPGLIGAAAALQN